ncbi:uncharacterized protein LOC142356369 isoform X2 [Convolutriloba macropyga]|uniref:uncharacterized protein LOC142356369 isoform X2 n=1 Tax=Convolutriloba macropyga TaxID=536237 RepID=UPI003F51D1F5
MKEAKSINDDNIRAMAAGSRERGRYATSRAIRFCRVPTIPIMMSRFNSSPGDFILGLASKAQDRHRYRSSSSPLPRIGQILEDDVCSLGLL